MSKAGKHDQEMLERGYLRVLVAREIAVVPQTTMYRWIRNVEVESEERGSCTYVRISSLAARLDPTARGSLEASLKKKYGDQVASLARVIGHTQNNGYSAS